jgi:hypothetical protein
MAEAYFALVHGSTNSGGVSSAGAAAPAPASSGVGRVVVATASQTSNVDIGLFTEAMFVGLSGPGLPLLRDASVKLKLRASTTQKEMHVLAAQKMGPNPRDLTLRPVIVRQNHTIRPDEPLDPLCTSTIETLVVEGKQSLTVTLVALPRSIAIPFASHDDLLDDSDDKTILLFFKRCAAFLSVLCCTARNNKISRKPCSCNHIFVCLFCSACAAVVSAPTHCQPLTPRALFLPLPPTALLIPSRYPAATTFTCCSCAQVRFGRSGRRGHRCAASPPRPHRVV